ncbi:Cation channel sperm-associated protein 4 [Terramyces sp. JEL0728]|nr:Cation channel sperm-associated protein 4 [Terramyces sp. JEL0728]
MQLNPRISKETLQKASVATIAQETGDLSEAYDKLESFKQKAKLEQASKEDTAYIVENTYCSDHKITISETISKLHAAKIGRMENIFESDIVRFCILGVVIAQCLTITLQTDDSMVRNFRTKYGFDVFQVLQYIFMAAFATEIGVKFYIYKMKTFHSTEYMIYLLILLIELGAQATDYHVVNISILVFGLTYLWSNAAVVLFADSNPLDFGNLGTSFFSLFVAITQIGWADSLARLEIIVAVIVSNLEDLHKKAGETRKKRIQKLKSSKAIITGQNFRTLAPVPPSNVPCWESQIPYEVPNFDLISKAKLENYFTVLAIMEENLSEYLRIVDSLKHIQGEIKELNSAMRAKMDEKHEIDFDDDVVNGNDVTGDALSRLLTKKRTQQKRRQ